MVEETHVARQSLLLAAGEAIPHCSEELGFGHRCAMTDAPGTRGVSVAGRSGEISG